MAQAVQLQPVQSPAAADGLFVSAQSCCDCLTQRIQAIWEAFCAYLASWISWGLSFISDTSAKIDKPVTVMQPEAVQAAAPQEAAVPTEVETVQALPEDKSKLIADYEKFVAVMGKLPSYRTTIQSRLVEPLKQAKDRQATLEEQVACIRNIVQENDLIFWAASSWANERNYDKYEDTTHKPNLNFIAVILKLGGDPNQRVKFGIHRDFTPLVVAVLTQSLVAYEALREAGADPHVKLGENGEGEDCIQLASRLKGHDAHGEGPRVQQYKQFVSEAGFEKLSEAFKRPGKLPLLHPTYSIGRRESAGFGDCFIDVLPYEEDRSRPDVVCESLHRILPRPLALIIAAYAKSRI